MRIRLRERLLIPILMLIMMGMGFSIITSNKYAKKNIADITKSGMIQTVENISNSLNSWLLKQKSVIEIMAELKSFQNASELSTQGDLARIEAIKTMKKYQAKHNEFDIIFIADLKGDIIAASKEAMIGKFNIKERKYFKETLQNKPVFSDAIISKATNEVVFTINYPLIKNSKVVGILSGIVKLNDFTKSISNIKIGKSGYIFICNQEGTAIYHPNEKIVFKASLANYGWGREMMADKKGYKEYKWGKTPTISVFQTSDINRWMVVSRAVPEEIFEPIKNLQNLNLIIAAITIITLSIAIVLLTQFIILKPVKLAVAFAKQISSGDLNARMELKQTDELGDLVASLNGMGDNLKDMFKISALRELVEKLSGDSANLSNISAKMNSDINDAANKSGAVSHASVEIAENIKSVAATLEESTENMTAVAAGAEEMSSTIDEIAENTEKTSAITKDAVLRANGASSRINMLGDAAKEIGAVTGTIKDISEQTNLLALNATIEAARAGDAGKGFAVVASEIKDLASQTATATADIATKILNIQNSTDKTVTDINEIGSTINEIDAFVTSIAAAIEEQSVTTREIAEGVNQASSNLAEVNSSTGHYADSAQAITTDISVISQITGHLMDGSSKVNQSSLDLEKLSSEVRKLVGRFKI